MSHRLHFFGTVFGRLVFSTVGGGVAAGFLLHSLEARSGSPEASYSNRFHPAQKDLIVVAECPFSGQNHAA